jgi:hypothetical protein
MATIFEQILDTNAIEVDDDGSLGKLVTAAGDVEKLVRGFKLAPATAVLVAMDSEVGEDEPMLEEVQTVVKKHWPTLRRRHVEMPVALLRAVLTEALARASKDDGIGSILWLTGASYAPFSPPTAEASVWSGLLRDCATRAEMAAVEAWASPTPVTAASSETHLPVPKFKPVTITESWLAARLKAAVSPVSDPPEGVTPNSNYIVQNYRAEHPTADWAEVFGKTAAKAIAEGVHAAIQGSLKDADFQPFVAAVNATLASAAKFGAEGLAPLHSVELRSRILLWDRAHYSDSLHRGYRELPVELAAVAMAIDLAAIVPPMSPRSIDALFWESVRDVVGGATTSIPELAGKLARHRSDAVSLLASNGEAEADRRGTLLRFLRRSVNRVEPIGGTRRLVGVPDDQEIPLADLARWIFRDIRAEQIAHRPRRRK